MQWGHPSQWFCAAIQLLVSREWESLTSVDQPRDNTKWYRTLWWCCLSQVCEGWILFGCGAPLSCYQSSIRQFLCLTCILGDLCIWLHSILVPEPKRSANYLWEKFRQRQGTIKEGHCFSNLARFLVWCQRICFVTCLIPGLVRRECKCVRLNSHQSPRNKLQSNFQLIASTIR